MRSPQPAPAPTHCPGRDKLIAFTLGKVTDDDLDRLGRHLEGCPSCRVLLDEAARQEDSVLAALRQPPQPGPHAQEPGRSRLASAAEALALGPTGPFPERTQDTPHPRAVPADSAQGSTVPELRGQFGRYQVKAKLGKGGMGHVYLAYDPKLAIQVALKVPEFGDDFRPELLERFYREARAAAQLNHPNLCRIFDVGEAGGVHYLAMQYVEGRPLSDLVRGGRQLPEGESVALAATLARALEQAHARGVVHRDLKPANIMMTGPDCRQTPVVVDFGLALQAGDYRVTARGEVLGTPAYMPPEQIDPRFGAPDPRCDIYSLGVVLYQLLTGRLPFEGALVSVLHQVCHGTPRSPSAFRPGLDSRLEAVCLKAMARNPEDRYASMADFSRALAELGARAAPASPTTQRQAAETPWLALAVAAAALLTAAALAWKLARRPEPPLPPLAIAWHGFVQRERDGKWQEDVLRDGATLYNGDQFRIAFRTSEDCYVYVVNVDGDGRLTVLFPGADIKLENRCRGDVPYEVPDGDKWFTLDSNTGTETVYLLASYDPLDDVRGLLARQGPPGKRRAAGQLEEVAHKLEASPGEQARTRSGRAIDLRGVTVAPDRKAMARLAGGRETHRAMEIVFGAVNVVKRIRFEHRAAPPGQ